MPASLSVSFKAVLKLPPIYSGVKCMGSDGHAISEGHETFTVLAVGDSMFERIIRPPLIFFTCLKLKDRIHA